jgi:hypothetical protein
VVFQRIRRIIMAEINDKEELFFYDDEVNGVSKLRDFILDNDINRLVFSRNGEVKKVFKLVDESAE